MIEKYTYELTLCNSRQEPIQVLENIFGLKYEARFPTTDEITFNIPFYVIKNGIKRRNNLWDLVKGDRLIHCKKIYDENIVDEKYFLIVKCIENDNDTEIKEVIAYSQEYELNKKIIRQYNLMSRKLYSPTNELDDEGFQIGVLNYISTLTSWDIGEIDEELLSKFRQIDISEVGILGFLSDTIQQTFGCVFIYDTVNKRINAKLIENVGQNKGFYLSEENYIKTFQKEINHDEIITRLYVYGANDISINSINPTGESFVEDFSYYKLYGDMSQGLIDALNTYEDLLETKTTEFSGYLSQLESLENQLTLKQNELTNLQIELAVIQDNIDVAIQNGDSLASLNSQKSTKESQINAKNIEINNIKSQINSVNNNINNLRNAIKKSNNFSSEQLVELDFYVREKSWTDTNYEKAEDLWEEIPELFGKINQPPIQFDIDSLDFTKIVMAKKDWNKFILGDILNIEHSKFNFYVQVRLIGYTHDIDSNDLKLNFSNKNSYDDPNQYINDLLKNAITAGVAVDMSKYKWDKSEQNHSQIQDIINNALDAAKNNVLAGKNQNVVINDRGIALTDTSNPNEQLRIINNTIAMTDNGWQTAKLAITPGKIFAEHLFGNIIAGSNLTISTGNGDFLVNETGVTISNTALKITGSLSQDKIQSTGGWLSTKLSDKIDAPGYVSAEPDGFKVYDASSTLRAVLGSWLNGSVRKYGIKIVDGEIHSSNIYGSNIRTGSQGATTYIEISNNGEFRVNKNGVSVLETYTQALGGSLFFSKDNGIRFGQIYYEGTDIYHSDSFTILGFNGTASTPVALKGSEVNLIAESANGVNCIGDFWVTAGTKHNIEYTKNYGARGLVVRESPEQRYIDEGIGVLFNGECTINIDPIFLECIESNDLSRWFVQITPYADIDIYVSNIGNDFFIVKEKHNGTTTGVEFTWSLSATRINYAGIRLMEMIK